MLEIIAVIVLCQRNGRNAEIRGRSKGWAIGYTILLWIVFELLGAFVVTVLMLMTGEDAGMLTYVGALLGAGIGALLANAISKRGQPVMPDYGNLNSMETHFVQGAYPLAAPCEILVIREKSFNGKFAKFNVQLNGQSVGYVANKETLRLYTQTVQNVITANDALGMRMPTSVPFDAPPGGRVEIVMKGNRFLTERTRIYPGVMQPEGVPVQDPQQATWNTSCQNCGTWGFPPAPNCPSCGAPQ